MQVLLSGQIRAADQYTIQNEPIDSIDLMERACCAFVSCFTSYIGPCRPVWVFCGTGNNGGDGLGIARLLFERRFSLRVFVAGNQESGTPDFRINYERLANYLAIENADENFSESPPDNALIIDALFGTGLSRPVDGMYATLIEKISAMGLPVVAVDVPSGLFTEKPQVQATAIQASLTITFQLPKLAYFLPENHRFTGKWRVVNIGLSREFLDAQETPYYFQQPSDDDMKIPDRPLFMHKGMAGWVLIAGGSRGKVGALILSASACMRAGAGLVTVRGPSCISIPVHVAVPEVMVEAGPDEEVLTEVDADAIGRYDVVAAGPGLSVSDKTTDALHRLITACKKPMVLDADALNILSRNPQWIEQLPANSILTPHPLEFKRLVGEWRDDYHRLEKQISLSTSHSLITVVKGAFTTVCTPEGKVYFNSTGNPGMASGGSGDVLTGVIAALLAQGFSPEKSARLGVLLHGLAGDLARDRRGEYGMVATDIVEMLPEAFEKQKISAIF